MSQVKSAQGGSPTPEAGSASTIRRRGRRVCLGLIAALAAIAAIAVASGCGGSGGSSTGSGGSGLEFVATAPPAKGDIDSITWDLPFGEPTSLNPLTAYNYSENTVLGNICEGLLRDNPAGEIEPALASKVEHPTPTTWVYTIRQGVRFWDGEPLTADDVVYSLQRQIDPNAGSYYYLPFGEQIASVAKTGPEQVTVTTKTPNYLVNDLMTSGLGTIVEAKYAEEKGEALGTPEGGEMCTGPFKLAKWTPGNSITLVRNDQYWDKSLRAKAARITFEFVTDQNALTNALLSGEIDGVYNAPVSGIPQLAKATTGRLTLGPSTESVSLVPTGTPPLEDVRLRKALSMVIDREGISNTVYEGAAEPMLSNAAPQLASYSQPIFKAAYEKLNNPEVDIEGAKKLIEEAGAPSAPLKLLIASGDPSMAQIANTIYSGGQQIGLPIKIEQLPPAQFSAIYFEPKARKKYDMVLIPTGEDVYDPMDYYFLAAGPQSVQNFTGYDNAAVNKELAEGLASNDPDVRAEAAVEIAAHLHEDLPSIPVVLTPARLFQNNRIAGTPSRWVNAFYPWAASIGSSGSE
ncbi:MAG TPA: ABC transporter substrate-binding protein [Solirubrobacterales bacterium]|nr:ABC transporter substrate-binding protein [Solirubrobacterales bacterium]